MDIHEKIGLGDSKTYSQGNEGNEQFPLNQITLKKKKKKHAQHCCDRLLSVTAQGEDVLLPSAHQSQGNLTELSEDVKNSLLM